MAKLAWDKTPSNAFTDYVALGSVTEYRVRWGKRLRRAWLHARRRGIFESGAWTQLGHGFSGVAAAQRAAQNIEDVT